MAQELSATLDAGLSVTATLMLSGAVAASGIVVTESLAVPGFYSASVPPDTGEGLYAVLFLVGGRVEANGLLDWTGTAERVLASQASVTAIPTNPLLASGYTAPDNAGIAAIDARLPADPAAAGGAATAEAVADAVLAAQAGDGTVEQALAKINVTPADVPVVVVPGAPAAAAVCRVHGYLRTIDNKPAINVPVQFNLVTPGPIKGTVIISGRVTKARSNALGQLTNEDGSTAYVDLVRNSSLTPAGSYYTVTCHAAMLDGVQLTLDGELFDIATLVAQP